MAAMMNTQALREAHVRPLPGTGRACPCCTRAAHISSARKLRRTQRRREAQAFRAGRED
jgi:hypothetical protein